MRASGNSARNTLTMDTIPTLLPVLSVTNLEARQLTISWTYGNKDPKIMFPHLAYQISRAEEDVLSFVAVYEGDDTICTIVDLKPSTQYRLKLRLESKARLDSGRATWSKHFQQIEICTPRNYFLFSRDACS